MLKKNGTHSFTFEYFVPRLRNCLGRVKEWVTGHGYEVSKVYDILSLSLSLLPTCGSSCEFSLLPSTRPACLLLYFTPWWSWTFWNCKPPLNAFLRKFPWSWCFCHGNRRVIKTNSVFCPECKWWLCLFPLVGGYLHNLTKLANQWKGGREWLIQYGPLMS